MGVATAAGDAAKKGVDTTAKSVSKVAEKSGADKAVAATADTAKKGIDKVVETVSKTDDKVGVSDGAKAGASAVTGAVTGTGEKVADMVTPESKPVDVPAPAVATTAE